MNAKISTHHHTSPLSLSHYSYTVHLRNQTSGLYLQENSKMFSILSGIVTGLSSYVPPGLLTFCAAAFIADGSLCSTFTDEFIGTVLMIGLTFSPGKWIATTSTLAAWAVHAVGVVAADKIGGGQHVNPSVSLAMFSLGKCSYTEMLVRIAGAMSGGLCAFPFFQVLAEKLD